MNRRRKIFERVVNPLLNKYLTDPFGGEASIAKNIPMKYLSYFKEVSASHRAKPVRYRYRGISKVNYDRPQSFCHMNGADTFSVYPR